MKRLVTTPLGTAALDIAGSGRHDFVELTVFGDNGWAVREEMWWSHHEEGLGAFISRLTGLTGNEAERVASDYMGTWDESGGRQEGARLTRRLSLGVVGVLLVVGLLAVLGTVAVRSILTSSRGADGGR